MPKNQGQTTFACDKFAAAPKRKTERAVAPTPFIAPESTVHPSILATIKTKPDAAPAAKARPGP